MYLGNTGHLIYPLNIINRLPTLNVCELALKTVLSFLFYLHLLIYSASRSTDRHSSSFVKDILGRWEDIKTWVRFSLSLKCS